MPKLFEQFELYTDWCPNNDSLFPPGQYQFQYSLTQAAALTPTAETYPVFVNFPNQFSSGDMPNAMQNNNRNYVRLQSEIITLRAPAYIYVQASSNNYRMAVYRKEVPLLSEHSTLLYMPSYVMALGDTAPSQIYVPVWIRNAKSVQYHVVVDGVSLPQGFPELPYQRHQINYGGLVPAVSVDIFASIECYL